MKAIICAACKTFLGVCETYEESQAIAREHLQQCTATPEEYEQAVYDLKFRQITGGLDL